MARTARTATETNGDGETTADSFRISITIDPSLRRKLRLAAAIADMTVGEWCSATLEKFADKEVAELPKRKDA